MATAVRDNRKGWFMTDDDFGVDQSNLIERLRTAIEEVDPATVLDLLREHAFTVFELRDEEGEEDDAAATLTAEVDDFEAVVAFTSDELAADFAQNIPEVFEGESEEVPGFHIDGESLLFELPEGFGLLLNPESDGTLILTPDLVASLVAVSDALEDDDESGLDDQEDEE